MRTESLTVSSSRLPTNVAVGQHLELRLRTFVRKIEADTIDVSGYGARGAIALLGGEVEVELAIEHVEVLTPDSELVHVDPTGLIP